MSNYVCVFIMLTFIIVGGQNKTILICLSNLILDGVWFFFLPFQICAHSINIFSKELLKTRVRISHMRQLLCIEHM